MVIEDILENLLNKVTVLVDENNDSVQNVSVGLNDCLDMPFCLNENVSLSNTEQINIRKGKGKGNKGKHSGKGKVK